MSDMNRAIVSPEKEDLPLEMDRGKTGADVFLEIGFGNGEFSREPRRSKQAGGFWGVEQCQKPA